MGSSAAFFFLEVYMPEAMKHCIAVRGYGGGMVLKQEEASIGGSQR